MYYAALLISIGFLFVLTGVKQGELGWLLAWLGCNFVVTGFGYWNIGSKIFGKRESGTLPLWSKIFHLPYLLCSWSIWRLIRLFSKEPPYHHVTESLAIGRRLLPHEKPNGFVNWVDLTAEFTEPEPIRQDVNYICLPILDGGIPSEKDITTAIRQIKEGSTYIHCAQGHGRTAIFAILLMHDRGRVRNYEEALDLLRRARPAVSLNKRQERFVTNYLQTISQPMSPKNEIP
ncbi:MAG: hypothetical protein C4527_24760 [Candidatus Omnitrophota bacterium]|jgi:protein-tyrosine phosphatase|nr:MAG: hypothetical protein C4527_24760 [Candidatus Omnitrophota bacterium]